MLKVSIGLISKAIMVPSQILIILCTIVIAAMETQREVLATISVNYNTNETQEFKLKPSTIPLERKNSKTLKIELQRMKLR